MKKGTVLILLTTLLLSAFAGDEPTFRLVVYDKMNRERIRGAEVKLQDISSGRTFTEVSNDSGMVSFTLYKGARFRLEVSKDGTGSSTGYLSYTYVLSEKEITGGRIFEAELEKVKHNDSGLMPAMYFEYNSAKLSGDNYTALDNLLKMFNTFPTLQVEIGVYADCREGADITAKRATEIRNYILRSSETKRVTVKEFGKTRALNQCDCSNQYVVCSEQKYQENRRAEFKILSF